jgi:hypothetical protein
VSFDPYGAAVFRFHSAAASQPRRLDPGALPGLSLRTIPQAEPTSPHGEFVRADLIPDAAHTRAGAPAFQSTGILTRTKVDTFLFTQFHWPKPLDLSDADCLALETWVPEDQTTANQILVILHEEGGGDFLAETGRSLAGPAGEKTFLAFNRFKLAGWSQDADGVLDLKKVTEMRIGWGGYLGTEGETVRFSVALPQVGVVLPSLR